MTDTQLRRIEAEWTWETLTPMHCGSGVARPGYADRLLQRDRSGRPVMVGDAVKGALRLAAEQILGWQGYVASYGATAEPTHPLLAALFGGHAEQRYSAARLDPAGGGRVATMVVPSTAIDRHSGRALDNTLRGVEILAPGARFAASCTVRVPADRCEPALTLLVAALAAAESVGAKAGIGWGRVKLAALSIAVDGEQRQPFDLLSETRLVAVDAHDQRPIATPQAISRSTSSWLAAPCWWRITVLLREPTTIGNRPDVSNTIATLDAIPATTLRGALRRAWLLDGVTESDVESCLGPGSRWTPAVPAHAGGDGAFTPLVRAPLSFIREKDEEGFNSPHGIHDILAAHAPPERDETGQKLQWRPLGEGWMSVEPAGADAPPHLAAAGVERELRMHVARDYRTGSKRQGALFAREAICPADDTAAQPAFVAYARLPGDVVWPDEILLGRRTSAGNGLAAIRAERVEAPWPKPWTADGAARAARRQPDDVVLVQLLSPALLRDRGGHWLRTVDRASWASILGGTAEQILGVDEQMPANGSLARTGSFHVPGWMSTWRHGRAPVTCLTAGSAWRLRFDSNAAAAKARGTLLRLAEDGFGERRHEGYGWLAVDPLWLGWPAAVGQAVAARDSRPPQAARPWPGCESISRDWLVQIARDLPERLADDVRGPLQALALRARGAASPADCQAVLGYCAKMAEERPRPSQWRHLRTGEVARDLLARGAERGGDHLRFVIEALLIRAARAREVQP
jgi:CRISPR/Cas system CSM-associated protein Csm3 (group 7 of RAMP superfamily)